MGQFACASVPTAESNDSSKGNASGFCDKEVDALLRRYDNGEDVISPTSSASLIEALGRIQQAAPVVPLYDVLQVVAFRDVTGLRPGSGLPITWNVWEWR